MSQHDMNIANASGAAVRADLNAALPALVSNSSGASEPSTMFAYQFWADTTNGVLKQRNAANNAWIIRASLSEALVAARSSNTILAVGDFDRTFICTSSFTQTLTAAASLGSGWQCEIRNNGTGVITLDPNGSETVDGATTLDIWPGQSCILKCDGSNFYTIGLQGSFTTGDWKMGFKTVADAGWVMANDGTIGDASSGATTRANADTLALYTLLWNNVSNSWAAVSGGRGANAAADFAAHKTLALTKTLGRAFAAAGAGSGLTSRALGEVLGSQDAAVVAHSHSVTDPTHTHGATGGTDSFYCGLTPGGGVVQTAPGSQLTAAAFIPTTAAAATGISVDSAGSSGTGANMQPTTFMNVMIKL